MAVWNFPENSSVLGEVGIPNLDKLFRSLDFDSCHLWAAAPWVTEQVGGQGR